MATKATFSPTSSLLSVFGDQLDDTTTLSRDAAGNILVNGGAIPVLGGKPTVVNTSLIQVFGQGGNDVITLNEANGALPAANLFGGAGNDTITGGSGADQLFGEAGNDILLGKGGDDRLFGGAGNDTLTGGDGNDQIFGEAGNDRMIWNPGDDNDLFEGGSGDDTAEVNGGNGVENFTITANGSRVRLDRVTPAPFFLDIGTTENLVVNANGGDDVITASNGLANLIKLTIDGGTGNDTITGGDGNDLLIGGDGNDTIIGGRGSDTIHLGAGDDTAIWNPGDGSDVVDGQDGSDTLQFNGANINETMTLTAKNGHVTLTRDVAAISMDLDNVEQIQIAALGGADNITVNDLSKTEVKQVAIDLAAQRGGTVGDGQADTVTVVGTSYRDSIQVSGQGTSAMVTGLPEVVQITGLDGNLDSLVVKGGNDNDLIQADALAAGVLKQLTLDGGAGDDSLLGSQGTDMLLGGDGNDVIDGNQGNDVALMGNGGDTFQWDAGDGSDMVEGQGGSDTVIMNGSNANEIVDIEANGSRVRLTRDVGSVAMDINGVERIDFNALAGTDTIIVGDLTGTGVNQVNVGLSAMLANPQGDGQVDNVIVNGGNSSEHITLHANANSVTVDGLSADVNVFFPEATDVLTINGLNGDDVIDASGLEPGRITLALNGGAGNDKITGSAGNDLVSGGTGNDVALLGAGDDTFVWNPGDGSDTVDGQVGTDTLRFNGANINEAFDISANGSHARVVRNVAAVSMDVDNMETIELHALGGADTITVSDLSTTDVSSVKIDLAGSTPGTADGQEDTIIINATSGDDVITLVNNNGVITVSGLANEITITNFDANDRIVINGLGGDDVIEASGLTGILLTADGGDGDDVLIGSAGNDTLRGGSGDDVLLGGPGQDILDGGTGDNILIQSVVFTPGSDGAQATGDALLGQFMASSFVTAGDAHGATPIADSMAGQQTMLAQPQA